MWTHMRAGLVSGCCLVALAAGAIGCHHDHDDEGSRQSGYYQDRAGYDRHYDYGSSRGDYDRDRDRGYYDRHSY